MPSLPFPKTEDKTNSADPTLAAEATEKVSTKVVFEDNDKMIQKQEVVSLNQYQTMQQKLVRIMQSWL